MTNSCYLYSKANYSIRIQYNGETLLLPPFANRFKIADESKLGTLPDKVRKVTIVNPSKVIKEEKKERSK